MWPYLSAYPSVGLVESSFLAFSSHKAKQYKLHEIMAKLLAWYSIKDQASDAKHHWKENEVGETVFYWNSCKEDGLHVGCNWNFEKPPKMELQTPKDVLV